jgi:hypothetical protein
VIETPALKSSAQNAPSAGVRTFYFVGLFVVGAILLFLFTYGGRIGLLLLTHWEVRNIPQVWLVPAPLAFVPPHRPAGRKFSYFGYDFETPWTELISGRRYDTNDPSDSVVNLTFSTGNVVVIFDPAKRDSLQILKQEASKRGEQLTKYFDEQSLRTNYSMRSKQLYLTPHDMGVFSSRLEGEGNFALIAMKSIELQRVKGGLYTFHTERLRGFQLGDPAQDEVVIAEAYDSQDHLIKLFISSDPAGQHKVSQADIDQIICSLRPTAGSGAN